MRLRRFARPAACPLAWSAAGLLVLGACGGPGPEAGPPAAGLLPAAVGEEGSGAPRWVLVDEAAGIRTTASIAGGGLLAPALARRAPATPYDRSEPPGGQGEPAHFLWVFGPDASSTTLELARAHIAGYGFVAAYPLPAWRALWDAAGDPLVGDRLAALADLLQAQPAAPGVPLPFLPLTNAYNDFAAHLAYPAGAGGVRGLRFVGRFAQDAAPLRNDQLRYLYQGISADGNWLITASLPVRTAALPDDTEVAVGDPAAPERDILLHLAEWQARLDALAASVFVPDLAALDALLASVRLESLPGE
jgi:hypothetical protein